MAGIVSETGVAHARYSRVRGKALGDHLGTRLGAGTSQGERAQPAQHEVALQRTRCGAEQGAAHAQRLCPIGIGRDHDAQQAVGVAADRLRGAVEHDVGAHLQRALTEGSGEGVVADDERPDGVRRRADGGDVGDLHHGIGGRLHPHGVRALQCRDDGLRVGDVHATQADRAALVEFAQAQGDAGVRELRGDHDGTLRQEVHDRVGGCHAGGEGNGLPALQRSDRFLEGTHAESAVARVLHLAARVIGGRQFDGVVDRVARLGRWTPGVNELRLDGPVTAVGGRLGLLRHGADPNARAGH